MPGYRSIFEDDHPELFLPPTDRKDRKMESPVQMINTMITKYKIKDANLYMHEKDAWEIEQKWTLVPAEYCSEDILGVMHEYGTVHSIIPVGKKLMVHWEANRYVLAAWEDGNIIISKKRR